MAIGDRPGIKVVHSGAPVAGGRAGVVMIWAGACSNTNFPTFKLPGNEKKKQSVTDRRTDGPTDSVTYRSRARDKKGERINKEREVQPK